MPHEPIKAGSGSHEPFKAACVQMRSGVDRVQNTKDALSLIAEAAGAGAKFIVTPEMTNAVDRNAKRLFSNLADGETLEEIAAFASAAQRHGVWLLIGSMAVKRDDGRLANRSFLYAPDGKIAARYDKLHMFDVALPDGESWRESAVYAPGDQAVVASTPIAKIGLSICYDLRFPHLYRALAGAGAEILCVPSAFTKQTGKAHWKTLLTARAIECGSFVIAPAQGGKHEDGRETYGHSMIIDPWGDIMSEAENDAPGLIFAEIDPARVQEARTRIPSLALEHSFKVLNVSA